MTNSQRYARHGILLGGIQGTDRGRSDNPLGAGETAVITEGKDGPEK